MTLTIDTETINGHHVLTLAGRLNGTTAPTLESWLAAHTPAPAIWDVSLLEFISSAGIRVLVAHEKHARQFGRGTVLAGASAAVLEVLRMTGLAAFWMQEPSVDAAIRAIDPEVTPPAAAQDETLTGPTGARVAVRRLRAAAGALVRWNDAAWRGASLSSLGVAFGRGGLGTQRRVAMAAPVRFAALTRSLCIRLDDGESDVLEIVNPSDTFLRVDDAWSFTGEPALRLLTESHVASEALRDLVRLGTGTDWNAVLVACPARPTDVGPAAAPAVLTLAVLPPGDGAAWIGCQIPLRRLDPVEQTSMTFHAWRDLLPTLAGEGFTDDVPRDFPAGAIVYVWGADAPTPSAAHTLQIDVDDEADGGDETELIVRTLYADCRRVALSRLTGGYSASTWQVDSYDDVGRRLLPTVLKVGPAVMMRRENDAHERFVRPFILNNASVGLGMAEHGDRVGLRYNFLGVTGDGAQLQTLARRWPAEPAERMHHLYDQVIRRTLAPWYGQARAIETALYVDHTPLRLFPGLIEAGRDFLPFDIDGPTLWCAPLARELPNPWWFVREQFPRRREERVRCRVAITHGDLNLNNILSDERDNLYVIDFSETRERAVGSDFARLEPVFLLQQRPLADDPAAIADWLADVQQMYADDRAWYAPPPEGACLDPDDRAFVGALRGLARDHLGADAPAETYLLPALEWTLPIATWPNLPRHVRELSTWVAALQVARIETSRRVGA